MNALLFWFSAGLATLWTLLAACWWVIENAGFKSTWVNNQPIAQISFCG